MPAMLRFLPFCRRQTGRQKSQHGWHKRVEVRHPATKEEYIIIITLHYVT